MLNEFSRTQLLYGKDAMTKLSNSRVAVFGIGGVGGYVVEALARSGIGALDLIDDDKVCLTNFTFAKASYNSVFGKVESEWEKKDGKVVYNVVIPANCEAKIILPEGTELTAGPGEHFFEE